MLKKIVFALALVAAALGAAILSGPALADEPPPCPPECVTDSMEIVTWYPSPYSEYEELRLYPTTRDANYCDNDKIGLMYYDDAGTPSFADDDKIRVCKGTSLGWQELGPWAVSDNNIYNTNTGNMGIGTTEPGAKLDVAGGGKVGNDISECGSTKEGTIRYNSAVGCMEYCDGVNLTWSSIDSSCQPAKTSCKVI